MSKALTQPQKSWTIFVLLASIAHLLRDIMQFLSIDNIFTSLVVRSTPISSQSILWNPLNTVVIEMAMIFLCVRILVRKRFGVAGTITYIGVLGTSLGFLYYWFVL